MLSLNEGNRVTGASQSPFPSWNCSRPAPRATLAAALDSWMAFVMTWSGGLCGRFSELTDPADQIADDTCFMAPLAEQSQALIKPWSLTGLCCKLTSMCQKTRVMMLSAVPASAVTLRYSGSPVEQVATPVRGPSFPAVKLCCMPHNAHTIKR